MKKKSKLQETNRDNNPLDKKDTSPIVPQRSKFRGNLSVFKRELTEHQKEFLEVAKNKNTKIMFVAGPAGSSKAQPLDADILSENGWLKMGEIKPGIKIFGEDGNLYTVISIHPQGVKDIYKISFSDDTFTECTLDHLWFTQTSKDRNQRRWTNINGKRVKTRGEPKVGSVKTTEEILSTLFVRHNSRLNHSIPITKQINFLQTSHIISPYVLGAFLGDGCFRRKSYISFTSNDLEIVDKIKSELPESMEIRKIKSSKFDYSISQKKISIKGNVVYNDLKRLKLSNLTSSEKFIPNEYKFDNVKNRTELLRGLLDTDGHCNKKSGSVYFTTTSKSLSEDVRFIVESLGGICKISIRENFYPYLGGIKQGKNSYSLCICLPPEINPFYLTRKRELVIKKTKYTPIRYITNIELIGKKECQCILLDNPTHLYLTNNCIVTHNTYLSVLHALNMISDKKVSDLIYIRTAVESSDCKLGFLPGVADDKMAPYLQPLLDKLIELLPKGEIDALQKEKRFISIPVGFLRGLNWNAKVIIADEAQNMTYKELFTLITRTGEFSKVFIIGDPEQNDINGKSGFQKMMDNFDDEESRQNGIVVFKFTEEDIVRSGLVKFIVKKLRKPN